MLATNNEIIEVAVEKLNIHPKNVRKSYDDIEELAESIKKHGILQNLTVTPDPDEPWSYLVVIGNRRLTAAKLAGVKTIPCRVVNDMPESEQVITMLTENMQRSNLSITEEAAGIQMCLSDYGFKIEDIAAKTGLSQTTIRHRVNIAKLNRQLLLKRESEEGFQLNLTDLAKLEKVSNIATRNKILREATDSRDLAWKAQTAAKEESQAKVRKKLVEMAEKLKIVEAPNDTEYELYGDKWDKVMTYEYDAEPPAVLYDGDDVDKVLYCAAKYKFYIIRKAVKVKRELTEEELQAQKAAKDGRKLKAEVKEMLNQVKSFLMSLTDGKVEGLKEHEDLVRGLWAILLENSLFIRSFDIACALADAHYYDLSPDERSEVDRRARELPMHLQMLWLCYVAMKEKRYVLPDSSYVKGDFDMFREFCGFLALYGFSFADGDTAELIMSGTHPSYKSVETTSDGVEKVAA